MNGIIENTNVAEGRNEGKTGMGIGRSTRH
jgi:hypothetical protein